MDFAASRRPISPWHAGEVAIQRTVGAADRMEDVGRRIIRGHLPEQHREFFKQLPFVVLGAVDAHGNAWATLRAGAPGFLSVSEPTHLHVGMAREPDDPAEAGLNDGDGVGLLGIDLATRRRNRLNGVIRRENAVGFDVAVDESYGNCPRYIQRRDYRFVRDPAVRSSTMPHRRAGLDERARAMIAAADTFFVASYADRENGARQVDVSHRGGKAGFVRLGDGGVLTIPDFAGNRFFNTLGNILLNPTAGLAFADFATGDLLQLSGGAEVILESPEIAAFQGAERLWRFTPRQMVYRPQALPLHWSFASNGWSPDSLMTGGWEEAADRAAAENGRGERLHLGR